jgi:hypothetical protein
MPVIGAYVDHPTRPYVRVQINWADVPSATHAGVSRVDVETGECTPLRPYICYDGWELLLSCGHGTFWDTEAPFDRPFYYITTSSGAPCVPATTLVLDTFGRTLVDSWGSTESGTLSPLAWQLVGGTNPGNYDVTSGQGLQTNDTTNVLRHSLVDIGQPDFDIYASTSTPVTATGAAITNRVVGRYTDTANNYLGGVIFETTGLVTIQLARLVAGVGTALGQVVSSAYAPDERWRIRFQGRGSTLRLKAWPESQAPPEDWDISITDTGLTTGNLAGVSSRRNTGNLNGTQALAWDNFEVVDECRPCAPVSVDTSSTPITLENDGQFWLKDPVRPCNDQPVPLCGPGAPVEPDCGGEGAIMFVEVGAEIYADNSYRLRPMNRHRTIPITRPRSDVTTSLVLETSTFDTRDQVLDLAAPGSPLLFQGPSEYGVPDRYMAIGAVNVERPLSDHRIQFRKVTMPYEAVDRPAGPSQGICGTRVADICDLYPTWDDLAATGLTWDDLVRGQADPAIANPARRTWDDVEAEFADWDAVEADGRTWTGLLEGA